MNEKPKFSINDKLKISQEFLDKTKWAGNDNFDYLQIDSFRSGIYHHDTPIIGDDYALYYCVSGHRDNPYYTTGTNVFKFDVSEINILNKI